VTLTALLSVGPSVRPSVAVAQQLTATELAAGATVLVRSADAAGGWLSLDRRLGTRQRVAATGAILRGGGVSFGRVGLEGHYLVNPAALRGMALYAGAGLTLEMRDGAESRTWLTAVLGVETRPGRREGLVLEAAVGGGLRLSVGVRWRRFARWWRPG
jgi:hypothetical protein